MPETSSKPKRAPRSPSHPTKAQPKSTGPALVSRASRRTVRVVNSDGETDGSDASDESSDDALQRDPTVTTPWRRPSGKEDADYAECVTWKVRRWAWEFLRRNEKFQTACDDHRDDPLVVAKDFRLREFKDYRQEYFASKPRFAAGIRSFPKRSVFVEHNKAEATLVEVKTDLLSTEVLIRFQIAPLLLKEKTSLDYQLDQARRRLESFAKNLRQLQPDDGESKNRWAQTFDPAWLIAALRILDWKATADADFNRRVETNKKAKLDFNHRAIADALLADPYEESHRSKSLKKRSGQGTALLKSAHGFAHSGYLLIRSGKLKGSK